MLATKAIEMVKGSPDFAKMGMILVHLGVVRATTRDGRSVKGLEVSFDEDRLMKIREEMLGRPGILEVVILTNPGRLRLGEEIMAVAVGGDIRENVFPVLEETVNRIKSEASRKLELERGA